ncbi:MAG: TetR/AcrR family transcriptional regulator [Candidatus Dactylopiibacterium sp.]|nr:TetR/AcrR family transcriptional regulator [Candidatus Dactylopiibacterium sp.]
MGRTKTIDRDAVLDAAGAIIHASGAAALTIDAVARAAGISKGGVQSCFGTKDALIDALFERWSASYEQCFHAVAGPAAGPRTRVRAHAEATRRSDAVSSAKAAGLMAALLQSPEHLGSTRAWYAGRLAGLGAQSAADRRARLAFYATEGAFMLRFFGLLEIDATEWDALFGDVAGLLDDLPDAAA